MPLDFATLYVIILLNSTGFALVWAIIAQSYRSLRAARYWFVSLAMTCVSGPVLVMGENAPLWGLGGNLMVIVAFGLLWQGVRVFFGERPRWLVQATIVVALAILAVLAGSSRPALNVVFAAGQLIFIGVTIRALLRKERPRQPTGNWIAASALLILVVGQSLEAMTNGLLLAGFMSSRSYYDVAPWFLVLAITGVSIANLGLLLMCTDRLRRELEALASRDELTGLPNRRALNQRIGLIEKRARRLQRGIAVLMVDLDQFKAINDSHGHYAGDAALNHIARIAKRRLREQDFLARIGGDEFCILVPDTEVREVEAHAEELAAEIARVPFYWGNSQIRMAVSIGIHHWRPDSSTSLALALNDADQALISRKRDRRQAA